MNRGQIAFPQVMADGSSFLKSLSVCPLERTPLAQLVLSDGYTAKEGPFIAHWVPEPNTGHY